MRTLDEKLALQREAFLRAKARVVKASRSVYVTDDAEESFVPDADTDDETVGADAFYPFGSVPITPTRMSPPPPPPPPLSAKNTPSRQKVHIGRGVYLDSPEAVQLDRAKDYEARRRKEDARALRFSAPNEYASTMLPSATSPNLKLRPPQSPYEAIVRSVEPPVQELDVSRAEEMAAAAEDDALLSAALDREIDAANTMLEYTTKRAEDAEATVASLEAEIEQNRIDAIATSAKLKAGEAQVAASEAAMDDLRNQMEEMKKKDQREMRTSAESAVEKDSRIANLQIEIGSKRADIERLRGDLEAKTISLATANRWLGEKDKTLRECASHISELNAKTLHLSNAKSKLEAELKISTERIDELEDEIKCSQERETEEKLAHETLCERLEREREMFQTQKAAFRGSLDVAKADLDEALSQASKAQERCESLAMQISALRDARGGGASASAEAARKLAVVESKLVQADAMVGAKEREVEDLHAKLREAEAREIELQKALDSSDERAAAEFGAQIGDKSAISAELIQVKARAELEASELSEARAVLGNLSSRLQRAEAEAQEMSKLAHEHMALAKEAANEAKTYEQLLVAEQQGRKDAIEASKTAKDEAGALREQVSRLQQTLMAVRTEGLRTNAEIMQLLRGKKLS